MVDGLGLLAEYISIFAFRPVGQRDNSPAL